MRLQKVLHGLSRRPHEHVQSSLRCNKGARLDGKRARAVVVPRAPSGRRRATCNVLGPLLFLAPRPAVRTLGQNTARRHGQRRPTVWRCGGEELPECAMGRLVHTGLGSLSLVAHILHSPPPPPPREQLCNRYCSNKHTHLRDQAGSRSLIFDISIAHDRFGSSSHVQQNGSLWHPQDLDGPMRVALQRKTNAYEQTYADNQNISFLPAIMSTSNRMHGEFLRLFLQTHRETEARFTAAGMSSQRNQSESFRFKRAAVYQR
jgi:hypothetical protein